jgi:hypothetical protein
MSWIVALLGDIEFCFEIASVRWLELSFAEISMLSRSLRHDSPV